MIDARRLVVLRAIAEHRSFTRAAEALVMTQPAVSRQLAALEREVGLALVARGPRHVSLTPAGAALVEEAEAILPALEAAHRRMRGFAAVDGGAVRIGAVPSALAGFVAQALEALRDTRPRVEIQVVEGWSADLRRLAARGDLDLAVVSANDASGDVLVHEPFSAVLPASHPLAARRRLALHELADEPWIVAPDVGGRQALMAACAGAGFAPRVVATAGWHATPDLIAAGLGLALAPADTARRLRRGGVAVRAITGAPERTLELIRPPRVRRTAAERELERLLHQAATAAHRP